MKEQVVVSPNMSLQVQIVNYPALRSMNLRLHAECEAYVRMLRYRFECAAMGMRKLENLIPLYSAPMTYLR